MEVRPGVPASPGIASAPVFLLEGEDFTIPHRRVRAGAEPAEARRLAAAFLEAGAQLEALRDRVAATAEEVAGVLDAHLAILRDPELAAASAALVTGKASSAEAAVASVLDAHAARFEALGDDYLAQRASDMRDIKRRVLRVLLGQREEELARLPGKVIVVARDLTPSQTADLDRTKVAGFATDEGGPTSHTAIIARSLGIPAVVGLRDLTGRIRPGMTAVVDGSRGQVVLDPDAETAARFEGIEAKYALLRKEVERTRTLPAETLDGHGVKVLANIELPAEVAAAVEAGAEGVGLFRTEFLVRPGRPLPTEEDHLRAYRAALDALGGRPLTIRTLDLGADKVNPDPDGAREANPFLGRRSLRLCLERPDIFEPQVRAILRASALGPVRVLLPMVTSLSEFLEAKSVFEAQGRRLRKEGLRTPAEVALGVMVEVPAAALCADLLADHAAFFSIGTNDLIQYTLAVDRVNPRVAELYDPAHPAILRLVTRVLQAARAAGREVSVCGEMSGDPLYSLLLMGLGVRVLSMNHRSIPEVKQVIRAGTMEAAREVAREVRGMKDGEQIRGYLRGRMRELVPVLF